MATPPREVSSSSPELLEAAPHPRKVSSTSTSSGGGEGGDKTNRKAKNRSRSRKNREPKNREPLGTLVYRQHDLDSIKCLVAARMTRRYIPCESGPAPEKVKGSKTGELVNTGRTSFTLADGSGKKTRFIIGKKISVADVMVAVELLPLYQPNKALFAPRGHSLFTKDVAGYPVKHVTRWFKAACATAMFTKAIDFYKKNGDPNRQPRGRNKSQSKGAKK